MPKLPRRPTDAPWPEEPHGTDDATELAMVGLTQIETARYIAEFSAELSYLARRTRLDLLAYLLDMAKLEATRTIQKNERNG